MIVITDILAYFKDYYNRFDGVLQIFILTARAICFIIIQLILCTKRVEVMQQAVLFSILTILLTKRKVSRDYLAERFSVSKRTVSRYLAVLEDSGVPITSHIYTTDAADE